jgi:hypothetical protein
MRLRLIQKDRLLPRELSKPEINPLKYIAFFIYIYCNTLSDPLQPAKGSPITLLVSTCHKTNTVIFRRKNWITLPNNRDEEHVKRSLFFLLLEDGRTTETCSGFYTNLRFLSKIGVDAFRKVISPTKDWSW